MTADGMGGVGLVAFVARTDDELADLRDEWNALVARVPGVSMFHEHRYNELAWHAFRQPADRLFVIGVRRDGELVAIAPFRISTLQLRRMQFRAVRLIADWEGDKSSIASIGSAEEVWPAIVGCLQRHRREWHVVVLAEQLVNAELTAMTTAMSAAGLKVRSQHDSTSSFVDIDGTWSDYFAARSRNTRRNLARRARGLTDEFGATSIEVFRRPDEMAAAVGRFCRLEQRGWKGDGSLGIQSVSGQQQFCSDLAEYLASEDRAHLYFLTSTAGDLAASIDFTSGTTVFSRHVCYLPEAARHSPGSQLTVRELEDFFGSGCTRFDMMGLHPSHGVSQSKHEWATSQAETHMVLVLGRRLRTIPMRLKWLLGKGTGLPIGAPAIDPDALPPESEDDSADLEEESGSA